MIRKFFRFRKKFKRQGNLHETYADSVVTDSDFSMRHGEGRLHCSIESGQIWLLGFFFFCGVFFIIFRVGYLQIAEGSEYRDISENNTFSQVVVLPVRGNIYDRNSIPLAWNVADTDDERLLRTYIGKGFSLLLGFIRYPQKDSSGQYFRQETSGEGGVEEIHNVKLSGISGSFVVEKDAFGEKVSERYIEKPTDGLDVTISIDARVQAHLYAAIEQIAKERSFNAGAGILTNSDTGEIIALTSYPDFDNNILTNHSNEELRKYLEEIEEGTFVHRGISGLYSPGSTIKPFFGIAALEENIITPSEIIVSTGSIKLVNPYDPDIVYTYKDWRAHGPLTIYDAIAWSSNVYFYYIGGGYSNIIKGLGIDRLNTYANIFGFGKKTLLGVFNEPVGLVPGPEWKKDLHGEEWRVGDTYNTVIGQYSFQVTPLQLARGIGAVANGGYILEPHLQKDFASEKTRLAISKENLEIIKIGMRRAVTTGTARVLNKKEYKIAAKTGTAQIGLVDINNSLLVGFFPYDNPKYSFVIVMEQGKEEGALGVAEIFFDNLVVCCNEYFE